MSSIKTYSYYGFIITRTVGLKNGKKAYFYDAENSKFQNYGFRNRLIYIGLTFYSYDTLYSIKDAIWFAVHNWNIVTEQKQEVLQDV